MIPRVRPTVPTAEAASYRQSKSGRPSYTLIAIPPPKNKAKYIIGGKNKNRHADKKVENSQGRSVKDKTPILGMVERKGKIVARKIETTSVAHITPEVVKTVKNAMVYTDEWVGYKQVNKIYDHLFVKHNEGEYVNGRIYTNTIEGFWSILKRGIVGIYHFTSRKHIQKYVDEFVFRYNTRNNGEHQRFNLFLQNTEHRLTYNELING